MLWGFPFSAKNKRPLVYSLGFPLSVKKVPGILFGFSFGFQRAFKVYLLFECYIMSEISCLKKYRPHVSMHVFLQILIPRVFT